MAYINFNGDLVKNTLSRFMIIMVIHLDNIMFTDLLIGELYACIKMKIMFMFIRSCLLVFVLDKTEV